MSPKLRLAGARASRLLKLSCAPANKSTLTSDNELLKARAACFVSLKTRAGDLRGCIGTIEPAKQNLAEELIANAINAATRDPRFPPVASHELAGTGLFG